jgi:hypothetical protein
MCCHLTFDNVNKAHITGDFIGQRTVCVIYIYIYIFLQILYQELCELDICNALH